MQAIAIIKVQNKLCDSIGIRGKCVCVQHIIAFIVKLFLDYS